MERITPGSNCLLNPDELAHLLEKTAIEHSSFAPILNSLYYADEQVGGTKGHKLEFSGRLSIIGGVVEEMFGQLFGSVTTTGLYDRFIFGLCPPGFVYNYTPADGRPETMPDPVSVEIHADVWQERTSWLKNHPYLGRTVEHALRIAVICAAHDGLPVLKPRDLVPAFAFAVHQHHVRTVFAPILEKTQTRAAPSRFALGWNTTHLMGSLCASERCIAESMLSGWGRPFLREPCAT